MIEPGRPITEERLAIRRTAPPPADANTPRVSIGMPVWNGEAFIRQGLDSLLGQSFGDVELIISDNASTDRTQAICEEYARRDQRVRYHRNNRNLGLQGNFARVLDLATAPYFMWGCPDDQWDPSYIAKMVEVLDNRKSVVLAGSNSASIDQDGLVRRHYDNASVYGAGTTAARLHRFICARPGGGYATLLYGLMRTPVIKGIGYKPLGKMLDNNRGYFAVDNLTLFRMIFRGSFYVTGETLYFRRDVVTARTGGSQRLAIGNPRLERIPALAKTARNVHQYYGDLRRILRDSDLDPRQEAALLRATKRQELRFYPSFAWSLLERRIARH
jgi:glycosyltransferase involved in cell wall biosynthesis